jgi:sigma-B regulation protein RsbU (phosphoserine phosphatase)
MALGVDETWHYEEEQRSGLERGQIIVIGTDGIWESRNPAGQMFGKAALFDVIRNHALSSAQDILNAIVDALRTFQAGARTEDDITLVVVRVRHADGEGDGRHWKPKP